MKKIALLLFAGILVTQVQAQRNKYDIGLQFGASAITSYGNELLGPSANIGYTGSLFYQYNFPHLFSIRTGLAYERKGFNFNGDAYNEVGDIIGNYRANYNFDYITVPLLARVTVGNKVKLFVDAGPYLGYLVKQTQITKVVDNEVQRINGTNNYKPFDVGLSTAIGLGIPIGNRYLFSFEVRNNLGLIDINKEVAPNSIPLMLNATSFAFGLVYKLGQRG